MPGRVFDCSGVREAPPACVDFSSSSLFPLLPVLSWFGYQSVLPKNRINFLTGTGIELCQDTDMLFAIASVDAVSVTDLTFRHHHENLSSLLLDIVSRS